VDLRREPVDVERIAVEKYYAGFFKKRPPAYD
jgi:hypothetical protein